MILSVAQGYRKGLVGTALRAFGWLFSIIAAAIVYPRVTGLLEDNKIYGNIRFGLENRFSARLSANTDEIMGDIPVIVADAADKIVSKLAVSVADGLAGVCFSVFVYLALVLAIKLLFSIINFLFSKRSRGKGIIGGIDGLLGFVFGAVRGAFAVFVLLALMLPVSLLVGDSANAAVSEALFASMFAGDLYENNPLLLLTDGLVAP
jgi:uncharacterized membrane protein required for colicin V production